MKFLGLKLRNNWDIEDWTCFSMIIKDYARTDIMYPEYDYNDIRILNQWSKFTLLFLWFLFLFQPCRDTWHSLLALRELSCWVLALAGASCMSPQCTQSGRPIKFTPQEVFKKLRRLFNNKNWHQFWMTFVGIAGLRIRCAWVESGEGAACSSPSWLPGLPCSLGRDSGHEGM